MMQNRNGEPSSSHHYRSDRCVLVNGLWYVLTREAIEVGPFSSYSEATTASRQIADFIGNVDPVVVPTFIREFARRLKPSQVG